MTTAEELLDRNFGTIDELFRAAASAAPERTAIIDGERRLSLAAFDQAVDRVAASLQRDGLRPRDTIAICAATSAEYVIVFFGALRAGITVAPLAPSSTASSLAAMIADGNARIVFHDASTAFVLETASSPRIALDTPAFEAWLAPPGSKPTPVTIEPDWIFNIIYSSGTTGTPKGIEQPFAMRWQHVRRARFSAYDGQSVTMISTPLYSNTTLVSLFPALAMGGAVVLMRKFDARTFLQLAERHRATHAMLVPVQYRRLMALPDFDSFDLSSFKVKFSTSAPFAAALKADILKRWPGGLFEYYGMTEGGGTVILAAHLFPEKLHTVGRPAEDHDIRLVGEDGREVALGGLGEVVGRSEGMMTGYRHRPEQTAAAEWFDEAGRRFIRTGDIGRFDEDGFLTLMDRKKDMIISGGFNVYPSDIEAVLAEHPDLVEATVIGVPSEAWGETPVAFAVARHGAPVSADAVKGWLNERVGKTQRVADLRLIDALPRSAIGKVLKRELRDAYVGVPLTSP